MESDSQTLKAALLLPIILLIGFLLFIGLYKIFDLPEIPELIEIAKSYYAQHGYLVVLIGSLAEGLLFINWYLPGSIVAVLGVTLSREVGLSPVLVVAVITFSFYVTAIINYALGRYGWYQLFLKLGLKSPLEQARQKIIKYGLKIIFSTYIHPNLGALSATSAGILRLPMRQFLIFSAMATIIWNSFWGVVVYLAGSTFLRFLSMWTLAIIIGAWIAWTAVKYHRKQAQENLRNF